MAKASDTDADTGRGQARKRRGRCPVCSKGYEYASLEAHPLFPFCSKGCKAIDLGSWLSGDYRIDDPAMPEAWSAILTEGMPIADEDDPLDDA